MMNNVFEQGVTKTFHLNLLMLMETSVPTPNFEPKKRSWLKTGRISLKSGFNSSGPSKSKLASWNPDWGKKNLVWLQIKRISPKSVDVNVSSSCLPGPALQRPN